MMKTEGIVILGGGPAATAVLRVLQGLIQRGHRVVQIVDRIDSPDPTLLAPKCVEVKVLRIDTDAQLIYTSNSPIYYTTLIVTELPSMAIFPQTLKVTPSEKKRRLTGTILIDMSNSVQVASRLEALVRMARGNVVRRMQRAVALKAEAQRLSRTRMASTLTYAWSEDDDDDALCSEDDDEDEEVPSLLHLDVVIPPHDNDNVARYRRNRGGDGGGLLCQNLIAASLFPSLTTLCFYKQTVGVHELDLISTLPHLFSLSLYGCKCEKGSLVPGLKKILLNGVSALALKELNLSEILLEQNNGSKDTRDEEYACAVLRTVAAGCHSLERLEMRSCGLTENTIPSFTIPRDLFVQQVAPSAGLLNEADLISLLGTEDDRHNLSRTRVRYLDLSHNPLRCSGVEHILKESGLFEVVEFIEVDKEKRGRGQMETLLLEDVECREVHFDDVVRDFAEAMRLPTQGQHFAESGRQKAAADRQRTAGRAVPAEISFASLRRLSLAHNPLQQVHLPFACLMHCTHLFMNSALLLPSVVSYIVRNVMCFAPILHHLDLSTYGTTSLLTEDCVHLANALHQHECLCKVYCSVHTRTWAKHYGILKKENDSLAVNYVTPEVRQSLLYHLESLRETKRRVFARSVEQQAQKTQKPQHQPAPRKSLQVLPGTLFEAKKQKQKPTEPDKGVSDVHMATTLLETYEALHRVHIVKSTLCGGEAFMMEGGANHGGEKGWLQDNIDAVELTFHDALKRLAKVEEEEAKSFPCTLPGGTTATAPPPTKQSTELQALWRFFDTTTKTNKTYSKFEAQYVKFPLGKGHHFAEHAATVQEAMKGLQPPRQNDFSKKGDIFEASHREEQQESSSGPTLEEWRAIIAGCETPYHLALAVAMQFGFRRAEGGSGDAKAVYEDVEVAVRVHTHDPQLAEHIITAQKRSRQQRRMAGAIDSINVASSGVQKQRARLRSMFSLNNTNEPRKDKEVNQRDIAAGHAALLNLLEATPDESDVIDIVSEGYQAEKKPRNVVLVAGTHCAQQVNIQHGGRILDEMHTEGAQGRLRSDVETDTEANLFILADCVHTRCGLGGANIHRHNTLHHTPVKTIQGLCAGLALLGLSQTHLLHAFRLLYPNWPAPPKPTLKCTTSEYLVAHKLPDVIEELLKAAATCPPLTVQKRGVSVALRGLLSPALRDEKEKEKEKPSDKPFEDKKPEKEDKVEGDVVVQEEGVEAVSVAREAQMAAVAAVAGGSQVRTFKTLRKRNIMSRTMLLRLLEVAGYKANEIPDGLRIV